MRKTATEKLEDYYRRKHEMQRGFQARLHLERKYLLERLYDYVIWLETYINPDEIYYSRPFEWGAQGTSKKEITKQEAEILNQKVLQKIKIKENNRRK